VVSSVTEGANVSCLYWTIDLNCSLWYWNIPLEVVRTMLLLLLLLWASFHTAACTCQGLLRGK
jgi:hypothetical protein